ncbi:hypothetical protein Tdes44962_MAKER02196 [Teratosphaeria destructans]|uniref:Uncharacterized protein n=1 Tax=Teratosphaeria destructans TaxID=418781 RepID=A0A9W7SV89_9PEZI|nr:hypothetical protein Tdes44962_MAKER02196 [Teratosphaeria destructans]
MSPFLLANSSQCTSDDSCKKPCKTPVIEVKGIKVSVSEEIQAEARRRFSDAHCINHKCSCAITSDDQAQDFCKYWIEHDKEAFKGARYVNGGVDADKGHILCVFAK